MQPDTIIPDQTNPQSWNRFGYVLNNPIRHNDPTGHICVEKGGSNDEFGMAGKCGGKSNPNYKLGLMGSLSGWEPKTKTITTIGPKECVGGDWTCPYWSELEKLFTVLDKVDSAADVADLIVNYGRPAYKHLKGPISIGTPVGEGLIGGLLQFAHDSQNSFLNSEQMGWRAGIVGFEDGITDAISEAIGFGVAGLAAPVTGGSIIVASAGTGTPASPVGAVGGALAVKVVVSTVVNEGLEKYVWKPLNSYYFPRLGLGLFP